MLLVLKPITNVVHWFEKKLKKIKSSWLDLVSPFAVSVAFFDMTFPILKWMIFETLVPDIFFLKKKLFKSKKNNLSYYSPCFFNSLLGFSSEIYFWRENFIVILKNFFNSYNIFSIYFNRLSCLLSTYKFTSIC